MFILTNKKQLYFSQYFPCILQENLKLKINIPTFLEKLVFENILNLQMSLPKISKNPQGS